MFQSSGSQGTYAGKEATKAAQQAIVNEALQVAAEDPAGAIASWAAGNMQQATGNASQAAGIAS